MLPRVDAGLLINSLTALCAATIGAGAVVFGRRDQGRRQAAAAADEELKQAVGEVLVKAQTVTSRSHQFSLLAGNVVTSPGGQVSRIIGTVTALDLAALFEAMNADVEAVNRAAARIWTTGSQQTVALTNAVVMCATELMEAHQAPPPGGVVRKLSVRLARGRQFGDPDRVQGAEQALGRARKALAEHTRSTLDIDPVDLFAGARPPSRPPQEHAGTPGNGAEKAPSLAQ